MGAKREDPGKKVGEVNAEPPWIQFPLLHLLLRHPGCENQATGPEQDNPRLWRPGRARSL